MLHLLFLRFNPCINLTSQSRVGAHPAHGPPPTLPGDEMDDHRVQGKQTQAHAHVRKALPGAARRFRKGGQRHQEEARAAQDGRGQQSLRPLPLVVDGKLCWTQHAMKTPAVNSEYFSRWDRVQETRERLTVGFL